MDPKVEENLRAQDYAVIEAELEKVSNDDLIRLLDSKSIKLGDTACRVLLRRSQSSLMFDRLMNGAVRTKQGKVRTTSAFHSLGRRFARASIAYLSLLHDRSQDVLDNALFELVFLQDMQFIPAIESELANRVGDEAAVRRLRLAADALQKADPFIYSPHYWDLQGVWELDPCRFPEGKSSSKSR